MAVRTCCRVICFVLLGVGLVACTTSAMKLAPATPTTPYIGEAGQPAVNIQSDNYALVSDPSMPIVVATPNLDRSKSYSLAELINIAQMANPATGAAWERARSAAAAAGVAEAAYLPVLSADVLAGYAITSNTAPGLDTPLFDIPSGTLTTSGLQAIPSVAIQWLLFDFGARDAALAASQQLSFAANVGFSGVHQQLIFDVANAYYQYGASRAESRINREALENSKIVLEAAEARLGQGIGTTMEVAQAKQQVAQAEFDLSQAISQERSYYAALLSAMGISPTLTIKVQDVGSKPLPRSIPSNLEELIIASLQRRADVQAAFAQVKASEQGILAADAAFLPKIALSASANAVLGSYSVRDSRFPEAAHLHVSQPNATLLLGVTVPVFDGGLRAAQRETALANAASSAYDFARLQTTAAEEIVVAYDVLRTSLSGYSAATALVSAGSTNYDAALEYYRNGLGTLSDISVAQTGLLKAQYAQAQARSNALSAAATLAFATGTLTSPQGL